MWTKENIVKMRKQLLCVLISLSSVLLSHGQRVSDSLTTAKHYNKIDKLQDAKDVEHFLKSINKDYATFKVNNSFVFKNAALQKVCDSLHVKPFVKVDFDNNGYTDLMVTGDLPDLYTICIMDAGHNDFSLKKLSRQSYDETTFFATDVTNNKTFINAYTLTTDGLDQQIKSIITTKLLYEFGGFAEYADSPKHYNIQKIEYTTTRCFGTCPVFHLIIDSNRAAKYDAIEYNDPNGSFTGMIDKDSYAALTGLLNYIDFPSLQNTYRVNWTDDQACTLTITYDNGKTKTISDYGLIGSYGLRSVYEVLFGLRGRVGWE